LHAVLQRDLAALQDHDPNRVNCIRWLDQQKFPAQSTPASWRGLSMSPGRRPFDTQPVAQSAGSVTLPLPPHFLQRGPKILLPCAGCLITGTKPVPSQAGHTSSATSDLIGFIERATPAMALPERLITAF
jgi:hypothetical protein